MSAIYSATNATQALNPPVFPGASAQTSGHARQIVVRMTMVPHRITATLSRRDWYSAVWLDEEAATIGIGATFPTHNPPTSTSGVERSFRITLSRHSAGTDRLIGIFERRFLAVSRWPQPRSMALANGRNEAHSCHSSLPSSTSTVRARRRRAVPTHAARILQSECREIGHARRASIPDRQWPRP